MIHGALGIRSSLFESLSMHSQTFCRRMMTLYYRTCIGPSTITIPQCCEAANLLSSTTSYTAAEWHRCANCRICTSAIAGAAGDPMCVAGGHVCRWPPMIRGTRARAGICVCKYTNPCSVMGQETDRVFLLK